MCGIAAILGAGVGPDDPDRPLVTAMISMLRHRGPDRTGFAFGPGFALGNSRLRIVDCSENADLPFSNDDGSVWLAYNGEVTNWQELTARFHLGDRFRFRTRSDSEVVLRLYELLGLDFVNHLTGQFAFVIVDQRIGRAFVVRDFFGMRPMFWARSNDRIFVASEIKALLEVPDIPRAIDLEGIYHYFSVGYIPEERTPFRDIHELQGSNLLDIDIRSGRCEQRPYYELLYRPDPTLREEDVVGPLREAMRDSVRRNLVADAPVGITYSGGVDSSSILAMARELRPAQEIHTYSIVMGEKSFDESRYQRLMIDPARHPHHEVRVGPEEIESALYAHMAFLDEPTADGAAIPFYLLAREARRDVRVLLSGEGGDETFNAYETHLANKVRRQYRRFVPRAARDAIRWTAHRLPCDYRKLSFDFLSKRFTEGAEMDVPESHLHWRHVLSETGKGALLPACRDIQPTHRIFRRLYDLQPFSDELNRLSVMDIRHYFEADLMVKNDRMLMAHSVEPRLPFMDRLLLEFVSRVPVDLRIKGLQRRYLQKQAMKDLVPKPIFRRSNMGLEMPHSIWFLGPLRPLADRLLSPDSVERTGFLDSREVTRLWTEHRERRRDNGRALWAIIEVIVWFELFAGSSRYKDYLAAP